MQQENTLSAAERFRQHKASLPEELSDVQAPSGFVYKFAKPSRYGVLFGLDTLPQMATASAMDKWARDGVEVPEGDEAGERDQLTLIKAALKVRDEVLRLSREPKLVMGEPQNANEVCAAELPDEDLDFLMKWVGSGGNTAAVAANFPGRSQKGSLASASRKERGAKAVEAGGTV